VDTYVGCLNQILVEIEVNLEFDCS